MKITTSRVLNGPAGTATEVLIEGPFPRPEWAACIGTWFFYCPGQSVAWHNYLLQIIHLRHIPGTHKPYINTPHATHEVVLQALNPAKNPVPTDNETWGRLTPLNFVDQFELPSDAAALEMLEMAALAVVNGVLWAEPPLSGQKEPWLTTLLQTSAHIRGEDHPCE